MEKLTETEKFRCTKSEKALLKTLAEDIKISRSDYLRNLINSREKPKIILKGESEGEKTQELLKKNYHSLGKVGVNLNQIAHYFNLQHLKSFDVSDAKIQDLLLLDKVNKNELIFLRENLEKLEEVVSDIKEKIEEYFSGDSSNKI